MSKETFATHLCRAKSVDATCAICMEDLKTSINGIIPMEKCGHWIHLKCYQSYLKKTKKNNCPVCNRAIYD